MKFIPGMLIVLASGLIALANVALGHSTYKAADLHMTEVMYMLLNDPEFISLNYQDQYKVLTSFIRIVEYNLNGGKYVPQIGRIKFAENER